MKKPRIEDLVLSRIYPQKEISPNDWQSHIRCNLLDEVRKELICFYGQVDCLESQYPGLDYAKPAHRLRLNRFPHHRRLFRAFDDLRLTDSEIQRLCRWEGTRSAKEDHEAKAGIKIKDTTWEGVVDARHRRATATTPLPRSGRERAIEVKEAGYNDVELGAEDEEMEDSDDLDDFSGEESGDELQQSVGVELNQRLLVATEARVRGEQVMLDAEWEQWLKEAAERGTLSEHPPIPDAPPVSTGLPPGSYWGREIPEYLSQDPATLQAIMPPPPQYIPPVFSNSAVATAVSVPQSADPTGTDI